MEFRELIKKRKSNRNYKPDEIPEDIMQKLYKALQIAPSGSNKQDFKFIFVNDKDKCKEIAQTACHQDFIKEPPILMLATCKKGYEFNVAIAVDHMILEATNCGLGSCWIGWFDVETTKKILNVPSDISAPIMVTLGYAADDPAPRKRKELDELILHNEYK